MIRFLLVLLLLAPLAPEAFAQATPPEAAPSVLPMRERAAVMDRWLDARLEAIVPALMRREGIDMWIIAAREYNEDPVISTMLPATWLAARRRTVLVFHDDGERVERLAVARYDVGPFPRAWDPEAQPDQWARVAEIVAERDPQRIGINTSETFALADGLSASEERALRAALSDPFRQRLVGAENLAVGWLETRTPEEMATYPHIVGLARHIIHAGLSREAITPGVTTTDDLAWWYRDRVRALGLTTWFHPGVSVQRAPEAAGASGDRARAEGDFSARPDANVIQPGDLVWVDFGISYLGLMTDTQQMAYVLRPGETEAPAGLVSGLRAANRVQDLLTGAFARGKTGNEILADALQASGAENLDATIYTHPIGLHGHAAGPTIGLWDQQGGVPGNGDYPLYANTAHSIELNVAMAVPEWGGQRVRFMLEEDAFFDGETVRYIDGRQEALLLIPR
ncbi:M24 family metallopeptidase [Rubricoccus marinus]|uniref:M24 family metallopeptidase n=1 Tax=Rubricoccus marinus TaxID=716817 RepID=UPI001C5274AF|nr:M24 family metallopeptidase [Rubricoccus marinus]